jgi:hypothetical protein
MLIGGSRVSEVVEIVYQKVLARQLSEGASHHQNPLPAESEELVL